MALKLAKSIYKKIKKEFNMGYVEAGVIFYLGVLGFLAWKNSKKVTRQLIEKKF